MRILLSTLFIALLASAAVFGQARKTVRAKSKPAARVVKADKVAVTPVVSDDEPPPPPPPPRKKAVPPQRLTSDVFKDVFIDKWGVASLSLPDDLTDEAVSTMPMVNKTVTWTTYARLWKQPAPFDPSSLEADLTVTTWNADFKKIVPDLRPDLATPENLTLLSMTGDLKSKNEPGSFVREAYPLTIGGFEGGFFRFELPTKPDRFTAGWYTHRYYEGKAQRISLNVEGRKDELAKALKIIHSLRLEQINPSSIAEHRQK